ncbi:hypothetical protein CJP41_02785 [Lactobacillus plantarum]|nr:hypothetical protein CRG99_04665 [Lactiplantibacillus plantarum]MBO2724930.1 hypothetical protein [Lactiplantibacillus plantarum]MZU25398.1 hypothetical protein [Lactiplantibacillus plantarum]MZU56532.1 hypothetical protein [Lactiplantibacillus plantarum]MZU73284.1 hypothetical protein [Lactiplantibacillus plantarum]
MTAKLSEARQRANKKWDDQHKAERNYMKVCSAARSLIRNKATKEDLEDLEDLEELRELIDKKYLELEQNNPHTSH